MSQKKSEPSRRNPNNVLTIRIMGVLFVLYMLAQIVQGYIAGGEDAPSLGLLLLAIVNIREARLERQAEKEKLH